MASRRRSGTVVTLGLALALSGCGGSPGHHPATAGPSTGGTSTAPGDLARVQMENNQAVTVSIQSLDRVAPGVVVLRWRMVNAGADDFNVQALLQESTTMREPHPPGGAAANAVTLLDGVANRRYHPLVATAGNCLCTSFGATGFLDGGHSEQFVAAFPEPTGHPASMTVLIPDAPPVLDVPIGSHPGLTIDDGDGKGPYDPAKAATGPAWIEPVISDSTTPGAVRRDDGSDVQVRLSADVLFALNKATLTPAARSTLTELAKEVDASAGDTVSIDGYTDDSGNDAINNPLSQARARSVQRALQGLVTKQGVSYRAAGHGSADPVVPNDSAAHRALNRRVTVTFARPAPPKTTTPPTPAAPATATAGITTVHLGARPSWLNPGDKWAADPAQWTATVDSLTAGAGGLVTLTVTVLNSGPSELNLADLFSYQDVAQREGLSTSGFTLKVGDRSYEALYDGLGEPVGGPFLDGGLVDGKTFDPVNGAHAVLTAMFQLPAGTTAADVQIPGFAVAKGVRVG